MKLTSIQSGPLRVNTYILTDEETLETAIIDPGQRNPKLLEFIEEHPQLHYKYIVLTHGHFDHVSFTSNTKEATGAEVAIHENDERALYDDEFSLFCEYTNKVGEKLQPDVLLSGGEVLTLGSGEIRVLHTPGHTKGGISLVCGKWLFTGDTLFAGCVGRTDFPGGNAAQLQHSIKEVLFSLPGDYVVYPGHEESSTLDYERKNNPFVR